MNQKDQQLLHQVHQLVEREHVLRRQMTENRAQEQQQQNLAALTLMEEQLDQCWDLLRQRRALQVAHRDPDTARVRPVEQVENYLPHPSRALVGTRAEPGDSR